MPALPSTLLWPLGLLAALVARPLAAQRLSLPASLADSTARTEAIPRLAAQAAAVYRDSNRVVMLDNRFRLQFLAGRYQDAAATLADWRPACEAVGDTTAGARALNVQYEIYLRAKQVQAAAGWPSPTRSQRAFRERFAGLDDRTAALVARTFSVPPAAGAGRHPREASQAHRQDATRLGGGRRRLASRLSGRRQTYRRARPAGRAAHPGG